MMVFQLQISRDQNTLPLTRDYMAEAERALNVARDAPESLRLAGE
jgi:cyclopropane-fatty-acyl-phospholipid synthase